MSRIMWTGAIIFSLLDQRLAQAQVFMDVTSVTPGGPGVGSFTGSLGGATVAGSITATGPPLSFFLNAATPGPGGAIGDSTTNNLSPQFSYASVYSPTSSAADRIGWTSLGLKTEQVVMTFSSPITNPVFHVANLDWAEFSFVGLPGLTSITYLAGNFDGLDGLDATPATLGLSRVQDFNPATADGTLPGTPPPTSGPRSAYGSIQLNGTFTTIAFGAGTGGPFSDSGSFTLSVPEPGSLLLSALGGWGLAGIIRRRLRSSDVILRLDHSVVWD